MRTLRTLRLAALTAAALGTNPLHANDVEFHEDAILVPAGLDANDVTGHAIDVDGDTLVVSAHGYGPGSQFNGAVLVFTRAGAGWTQEAILTGSHTAGGDGFGFDLDLEGDRLVIGSAFAESGAMNSGEAYVFERANGVWNQRARLLAASPEVYGLFGQDVAIEGQRIAVGAPGADSFTGDVTVFEPVAGAWTAVQLLTPTMAGADQEFGASVALDGGTLAVGAPAADLANGTTTAKTGGVYVFEHDGVAFAPVAALAGELPGSAALLLEDTGRAVAIDGDTIVAGAPRGLIARGTAFVFERVAGTWSQSAVLASAILGTGWAGDAVAIEGDRIALGCPLYPAPFGGPDSGAVTMWERQSEGWIERGLLLASDASNDRKLGAGVAFDGARVLAGDPYSDAAAHNVGALYLFTAPQAVGESFCFGDGLGTDCPCSWNNSTPGAAGCRNSTTHGSVLMGFGSASVAADDLRLVGRGLLEGQPALLFHGTEELDGGDGIVFGNGLRCVGGSTTRVSVHVPDGEGGVGYDGLVASQGFVAGETARFQLWYRDPLASCGHGFNLSNGYRVGFVP